ncbi:MAG TPA: OmpH family outer membrane protein [Myxococcales bacterium LLY-WYZ-16_1]|nr:OmpH family outer membrane protein [Myxococcales bacterium LLY-WYZ-16_1]
MRFGGVLAGLALVLAIGSSPTEANAAPIRVGVVDVQAALQELRHYKQAKARLEKKKSKAETELASVRDTLKERESELKAKEAISAPGALAKDRQALLQDLQKFQQKVMASQQAFQQLEGKLTQQLLQRIQACTQQIAQARDLDFVFDTGNELDPNVLYFGEPLNLTATVVQKYRELFKDRPLDMK